MSRERSDAIERDVLELELPEALEPAPALRDRILDSVGGDGLAGFARRLRELFDLGEARVHDLLEAVRNADDARWEPGLPGVRLLHLDGGARVASADCGLVRVAAGSVFPTHRHLGDEWVLVLQGASEDSDGRTYLPGDLIHKPADSAHTFRATDAEDLVFAVVLHGGFEVEAPGRD